MDFDFNRRELHQCFNISDDRLTEIFITLSNVEVNSHAEMIMKVMEVCKNLEEVAVVSFITGRAIEDITKPSFPGISRN